MPGIIPQKRLKRDKLLINFLLVATKKASTRKWSWSQEGLTLKGWRDFTFTEWKNNSIQKLSEHLASCRELSPVSFLKKATLVKYRGRARWEEYDWEWSEPHNILRTTIKITYDDVLLVLWLFSVRWNAVFTQPYGFTPYFQVRWNDSSTEHFWLVRVSWWTTVRLIGLKGAAPRICVSNRWH